MQGTLVFGWLYVCLCVLGQMVSVGVVSDKVCINPVKLGELKVAQHDFCLLNC